MSDKDGNLQLTPGEDSSAKLRVRIIATSGLVVLVGFVWVLVCQVPQDPIYNGKKLTVWIHTYTTAGRFSRVGNEADDAVRHIGTNCIPVLLKMLSQKDSALKLRVFEWVRKQRLIKIHFVPAAVRNREASMAFIVLGDGAKGAVPALVKMLNENISPESQSAIEDALAWIGPAAEPAVTSLLRGATNSVPRVRASALWALGEIHAEQAFCIPALLHALKDSDDWVRLSAAHALGMFGADAHSAVPSLKELANVHQSSQLKSMAAIQASFEARRALRKIDPGTMPPAAELPSDIEANWSIFPQ
jgi:hypothetical protein